MAFTMPDYPMLRPEQVNPYNAALTQAFKTYGHGLNAAYAKQNIEQALQKIMAETAFKKSETQKNQFLMQHPEYINPQARLISEALGNGGGQRGESAARGTVNAFKNDNKITDQPTHGSTGSDTNSGYKYDSKGNNERATDAEVDTAANNGVSDSNTGEDSGSQQAAGSDTQQYDSSALAFNPPKIPNPTGNPALAGIWNKSFGMDPAIQAQLDIATQQANNYNKIMNDKNIQFGAQAAIANQSSIAAHKFLNGLDKSLAIERGAIFGGTRAVRDAAQEMDVNGNQMASLASQLFSPGHAIHDSVIELQQSAKANRHLNKDVAFDVAQGVIAANDHLQEKQQFYANGSQPRNGQAPIKAEILDALWNQYENQRPYIDPDTKMPNDAYKGTWREYLSPQAVNSIVMGKPYIPPSQTALQGMNWTDGDLKKLAKNGKAMGLPKEELSKHGLYDLAKREHKSLAGLKMELIKAGVL